MLELCALCIVANKRYRPMYVSVSIDIISLLAVIVCLGHYTLDDQAKPFLLLLF